MTRLSSGAKSSERVLLLFVFVPVLIINFFCGLRIYSLASHQAKLKTDYADANSIRNGLLSVDVWKSNIDRIAAKKLSTFSLTGAQEEAVRIGVEKALNALVGETERMMQKPQKTLRGKVRKLAFKVFVDSESLTEQAPQYAQAVIDEVKKPENMARMKALALKQIESSQDSEGEETPVQTLLNQYRVPNLQELDDQIGQELRTSERQVHVCTGVMLGSLFFVLVAWGVVRQKQDLHKPLYALSVALAFILLLSALALPMIDIDARIKNVDFLLLGEHLQFQNQLLFYRSKSVMQMVVTLIVGGHLETFSVGMLIFLFSIVFPISKLGSTVLCLFGGEKIRANKLIHFFAYDSGKWSMADVMVVAIFMAYIGFNGVLNSQLKGLTFQSQAVGVIATNQTALQVGFTLFGAYVLFSMILSSILKRMLPPGLNR